MSQVAGEGVGLQKWPKSIEMRYKLVAEVLKEVSITEAANCAS